MMWMKKFFFLMISLLQVLMITSCQSEKKQPKKKINGSTTYHLIVEKWNNQLYKPNAVANKITRDWDDYNLLWFEFSQKPQPSLGGIRQKATALSKKTQKLLTSLPKECNNQETRSRIMVVLTKANMLESRVYADYLNTDKIITYQSELIEAFDLFHKQLERTLAKGQINFEAGELEMRSQLSKDSLSVK